MEKIEISIKDDSILIDPVELAEFLYLFKGVVVGLSKVIPQNVQQRKEPSTDELNEWTRKLKSLAPDTISELFQTRINHDIVEIEHITRKSPMTIVLLGCIPLIVVGVVISGGEVSIAGGFVKAKLRPLGEGIKCIKQAFGFSPKLNVGYGIRDTTIKLTPDEFDALMMPINGEGGFQSFLRGLQNRVNKQTREISLSQEDLQRIYKGKAFPEKGGFQSRFNKIFAHQFPEQRTLK